MKTSVISTMMLLSTLPALAQNEFAGSFGSDSSETTGLGPAGEIILPIIFIAFLVFMISTLVKYFLEFRLRNKLMDKGITDHLTVELAENNEQNRRAEVVKMAILLCGIGLGLLLTYFSSPIDIHSLAIMAISLGISYLMYFFYLRK